MRMKRKNKEGCKVKGRLLYQTEKSNRNWKERQFVTMGKEYTKRKRREERRK